MVVEKCVKKFMVVMMIGFIILLVLIFEVQARDPPSKPKPDGDSPFYICLSEVEKCNEEVHHQHDWARCIFHHFFVCPLLHPMDKGTDFALHAGIKKCKDECFQRSHNIFDHLFHEAMCMFECYKSDIKKH